MIPIDPTETPGWVEWASAAHLLMLDLGDPERAVDVVGDLRRRAVDVPVLIVAESVSDSPRLVALRLSDANVKTLTLPLTRDRLLRAVGRTMAVGEAAEAAAEEARRQETVAFLESAPSFDPVTSDPIIVPSVSVPDPEPTPLTPRVEWPSFDLESFEQSENLDWRTAFTPEALATVDPDAPRDRHPEPRRGRGPRRPDQPVVVRGVGAERSGARAVLAERVDAVRVLVRSRSRSRAGSDRARAAGRLERVRLAQPARTAELRRRQLAEHSTDADHTTPTPSTDPAPASWSPAPAPEATPSAWDAPPPAYSTESLHVPDAACVPLDPGRPGAGPATGPGHRHP